MAETTVAAPACGACGLVKPDVEWLHDPYLAEIHDEEEFGWWCADCFDTRRDDC